MINAVMATALTVLSTLGGSVSAKGATDQQDRVSGEKHFRLRYVINIAELDSTFEDNSSRITRLQDFLDRVKNDSLVTVTGVDFRGTASPDGSYEFNVWLSENRLRTFKELVAKYVDIPDSLIHAERSAIPWDEFRQQVEASSLPAKGQILEIIDEGPNLVPWVAGKHIDSRLLKLKRLEGGQVWDRLRKPILYDLRYGDAIFYLDYKSPLLNPGYFPLATSSISTFLLPLPTAPRYEYWTPGMHIKTNLAGWALAISNIAIEFDLGPHWSFSLPIYFSCWDYFKSTIKFRMLTYQPEFRYWFKSPWSDDRDKFGNDGFFIGAHFGLSYYNFAFDGSERYQDRNGNTPAIGGGLAIGYRFPISKNKRWRMEFSAGAGVYPLDYDIFENTPNYKEGQLVGGKKKTYFGLDQLGVTISYSIPLRKYTRSRIKKGGEL